LEISWTPDRYVVEVSRPAQAPVEAVYALLADIRAHLRWGGSRKHSQQYLVSLEAPEGLATVGTEFVTRGHTPSGHWDDRSRVTVAEPPMRFEFVTKGRLSRADSPPLLSGTWWHQYRLSGEDGTSTINYRCSAHLDPHPDPSAERDPADPAGRLPLVLFRLVIPTVIASGVERLSAMASHEALVRR
jgi:hypothetical protein